MIELPTFYTGVRLFLPAGAQTMQVYCNKKELCKVCNLDLLLPNNNDWQMVLIVWRMVAVEKMIGLQAYFLRMEPGV